MTHQALQPRRSHIPRFFRTPSTRLGWAATAATVGVILVVILVNIMAEGPGPPDDNPWWWTVFALTALLGMLASGIAGLIAVVRRKERSWMVIVPTTLVLVVVVNELVEGLVQFLG